MTANVGRVVLLGSVLLVACSGGEPTAPGAATNPPAPSPVAVAPTPAAAPGAPTAATEPTAASSPEAPSPEAASAAVAPEGEPVDLLHAIPTAIAVSSAYRDDPAQAAKLVDGDLETAWNSRTDELVGAWIDVALPTDARVAAIALTAGFTHRTERADLFEGNHRVSRVRVLRDGTEIGAYDLDPASRELQSIPVSGPGGTYRVEVAAVVAGSRETWRETCISELRVMGHAPSARPGTTTPRVAIRALPEIAPAEAVAAAEAQPALPSEAPAPPPAPLPPRLAALAATLEAEGVERLYRVEDAFADLGAAARHHAAAIAAADRSGTWLCAAPSYGAPRCVVVSAERVGIHQPHDHRDAITVSYVDAERFWIDVELPLDGSPPRAARRPERTPRTEATPLPPPALREPPAWLDTLRGLEIVSSTGTIAATDDGWLTVCRRDEQLACTPPAALEPLRRVRVVLTDVDHMFGEVCSVGFQWTRVGEQSDESGALESFVAETGQANAFVRVAESLTLVATVVTAMDRRTPSPDARDAFDVVEMESFDSDLNTETCLQAGRPTGVRRREDADGAEHALGAIAFARAPDELPATGVSDPLAISMEGAWTVLPEGGLRRRARRCPEY